MCFRAKETLIRERSAGVNTRTGKPVPDCKYTVWQLNYNDEQIRIMTSGITESDGNIVIEGLKNDRYSIELEAAGSKGNSTFSIPWQSDMPDRDYIRLFTDRYVNTSLEDLNFSLRTAQIGREGIVMLYENRIGGYPAELSDYSAGDNQRFAIWEGEAGKLLYDEQSYAGLTGCGSLD